MFFSELYSVYYNTVAAILQKAVEKPLSSDEIFSLVEKNAFGESLLSIPDNIQNENWQLLKEGSAIVKNQPKMPLTKLQKSWLKAISNDERIKLFTDEKFDFEDVEPLFLPEDIFVFDKYSDGDNFTDENYIKNFRLILEAIKNQFCLIIKMKNRHGEIQEKFISPAKIEYSKKDDKFRVITKRKDEMFSINIARILECQKADSTYRYRKTSHYDQRAESVTFLLFDTRNALERAMLHFAHFKKQAEALGRRKYKIQLHYNKSDETEILIRLLSFGPMVKVVEPENFVELVKERLKRQKEMLG